MPRISLTKEHVRSDGNLVVPVRHRLAPAPDRPGWTPFFVDANCDRIPAQFVIYRRVVR